MAMTSVSPYAEHEEAIKKAYEEGVTTEEAEKLAAKFLAAQIHVGSRLRNVDLDARMRKTGVKAIKAGVYLEAVAGSEKKPSDVMLGAIVDSSDEVKEAQGALDNAEAERNELENYLNVFREAHIFFRGIAKGSFGG